ncbi:hypothetical protein [Ferrimicrobium sp.]|uniref:DUF2017 family protein n=1 Tax=Ferrimicrobium sp. TaxID=2926050 RepID=UPI002628436D|nr:hypothetical protein [Ferrimicrobium sp.]
MKEPFSRQGDIIVLSLPTQQRDVTKRSMLLVAEIASSGGQEAWRLSPPMYDDPLLEAEEAVKGGESEIGDIVTRLRMGEGMLDAPKLSLQQSDELATLLNYCRLVLSEAQTSSTDDDKLSAKFVEDLYNFLGYLLSSLLEALSANLD